MEIDKFESIKIALMESQGDMNDKHKTNYVLKSHATIKVNDLVKKTIEEHGIENVLHSVYNELLEINKDNVDSVGIWVTFDGKEYENSIKLQTLADMQELGEEDVNPIFEFFKLVSPVEGSKD